MLSVEYIINAYETSGFRSFIDEVLRNDKKNFVFREFECGLTVEQTAKLCFKSVRQVKEWDKGKTIPNECKRLMRMVKGRELSQCETWESFKMHHDRLELPTGRKVTAQEVLAGIALLEIESPTDLKTMSKLLKYARAISKIKGQ